jgi:capsular polysaccharide biosynthesis protein
MNIGLGVLKPDRLITDSPIEKLPSEQGEFRFLPTPVSVECKPFKIFGDADFSMSLKRDLPSRSLSVVSNCLVHGQSAAVFTTNGFWRATHWAVLPELALNLDAGNYSRFFEKSGDGWRFSENRRLRPTKRIKRGVLIGSRYSFNFYHFVCDSLVRALIAEKSGDFEAWPLVITPSAPQIAEMGRLLCPQREIIEMAPDDLIGFEALAVPVSSSYSPDDPARSNEAVMDAPYLPELRDRLVNASGGSGGKILFVKRQFYQTESGAISRTIINQDDVIAFVQANDGETISPEAMTVEAQREAFSNADVVIAMAGSALANVIFCRPGTTIVMVCQNKIVQPAYFGMMFDALGLNFVVVASEPVQGSNPHPSHLSVTVDIGALQQAIEYGKRLR